MQVLLETIFELHFRGISHFYLCEVAHGQSLEVRRSMNEETVAFVVLPSGDSKMSSL